MILLSPALAGCVLLALAASYLWASLASPLRRVPGPRSSLFTSWILKWHEFRAGRTRYVHRLHLRYGPVVRIAPHEVVFASAGGVKEIYGSGGSGYDKTEFYDLFQCYGKRTMFSTLNKQDHAKRKRVLADRYANTNVLRSGSLGGIQERSKRFVDRLSKSVGGSVDLFLVSGLHDYAFDCVSHHLFHPYGSDSLRKEEDEKIMREVTFDDSLQNRLLSYYNPWLHGVVENVLDFFWEPRETPLADNLVLTATSKHDPLEFTLLSRMQDKTYDLDQLDMAAECTDHMAAGIDTTGDALCFLMWEISQPRSLHVQSRLQDEIRSSADPATTPFDKLPYLDAVVMEGLRCFPAIPMSLPRYTPAGGRTIDGYYIPGAYSTHRIDQRVFPEPERFNPDRWLDAAGDMDRKRLFFAFASGGEGVLANSDLALAEMKTLLIDVYSRYSTRPDGSMTDGDMEMSDQLISSQPRGKKCWMKLVPLEEGS
ncbi:sterigmatocystin biosynthesis P450 monooxygenase [Apiospora saccharicola]|uniref:Sterigmatocystin biosynthesis P450 monooxygenase n=1 Tax=Apiospora saccharicola TaxID=335842 RepID=A0ABR1WDK3_9PEZI